MELSKFIPVDWMLFILVDGRRAVTITSSNIPEYTPPRISYLGAVTVICGSLPTEACSFGGTEVSELSIVTPKMKEMSVSDIFLASI
jgi:hypothetical protein